MWFIEQEFRSYLQKGGILQAQEKNNNNEICVECTEEKMTNKRKVGAKRLKDVLKLTYADIFGPFPMAAWNNQSYFLTFIDDYS